jgi:glyoxylase-like metal-dependent hydrolase (beta-lactamase superfamily II)
MISQETPLGVQAFFHEPTSSVSYLVSLPGADTGVVIDPVLDFDMRSGRVSTESAEAILDAAGAAGIRIAWILETHAHADHLTAAQYLKRCTGAGVAIGTEVTQVQRHFSAVFNTDMEVDGSQFDRLLDDGESLSVGGMAIEVLYTPGHTPVCLTYRIGNAAFVGDTIFMPDYGTARTDFLGGDPLLLYRSIRRILSLPPDTRLFMCHDYKTPGRDHYAWETTVAEQRARNVHIRDGITEDEFVLARHDRDKSLAPPALLFPSLQVNIRAGHFPPAEDNGTVYLKIPVRQG